jgi:hypothetical protein
MAVLRAFPVSAGRIGAGKEPVTFAAAPVRRALSCPDREMRWPIQDGARQPVRCRE